MYQYSNFILTIHPTYCKFRICGARTHTVRKLNKHDSKQTKIPFGPRRIPNNSNLINLFQSYLNR